MAMMASDLNNPDFVGAVNPDSLLHVEFYLHEPVDKWASEEATYKTGRRVTIKVPGGPQPFVRIMRPGDQTSIVEEAVRDDHKRRWPEKWLYFQMEHGMIEGVADIPGWKLEEWPEMRDQPELLRDLQHMRFQTVEQVAGASDAQVQKMGIGGLGLRERAKQALRDKLTGEFRADIAAKDQAIADMQAQMEAMQKQMQDMAERLTPVERLPMDTQRKPRGRRPKAASG